MDPLKELEASFAEIIDWLKEEVGKIRSNRPTPKLVENIKVLYLDQTLTVNQLGVIGVILPREITITPWDPKSASAISRAIEAANLGVNVRLDGNIVRVSLPPFTEERIREFTKLVKSLGEESRIRMRSMRDKVMKKINELPENQRFKMKNDLQKIVDQFNDKVEKIVEDKIKEFSE